MEAGAGGRGATTTTPPLLAVGIVTAPQFTERRAALRGSWLGWPNVGQGRAVVVRFVLRSDGAPAWLDQMLGAEQRAYGDVLRVAIAARARDGCRPWAA